MNTRLFERLVESMEQHTEMAHGVRAPSREFHVDARVTELAERVFDSTAKAREWLKKANPALRGEVPLKLLTTDAGAELVTDELTRIEYGDLY